MVTKGFFSSLSPVQQEAALAYDGPENHGPDFFAENANKSEHHAESAYCSDHIVDANKMDCTDCDCADNDPCKRTAPGLALESGEFVPAEKITEKLKCWCTTCRPITPCNARFVVCPECGNKRCPKAHNHELTCTNSNDVGQKGSSWEHVKPFAQNNDPEDKTDWAAA